MIQKDQLAVGIYLGTRGAVIALVRSQPPRLVALADVSWPYGFWHQPDPQSRPAMVACRMLARARRRLRLPRRSEVSVVIGPSLAALRPEEVLAASSEVLAHAGLSQVRVTGANRAMARRGQVTVPAGALGSAAVGEEAGLAIGTAMASFVFAHAGEVTQVVLPAPMPVEIEVPVPAATSGAVLIAPPTPLPAAPPAAMPSAPPAPKPFAAPMPTPANATIAMSAAVPIPTPAAAPPLPPLTVAPTPATAPNLMPAVTSAPVHRPTVATPVAPGVWALTVTAPVTEPPMDARPVPPRVSDFNDPRHIQ